MLRRYLHAGRPRHGLVSGTGPSAGAKSIVGLWLRPTALAIAFLLGWIRSRGNEQLRVRATRQ